MCFVGALVRALNVERLRLAPGLRAPPRIWTFLSPLRRGLPERAHLLRWRPRPHAQRRERDYASRAAVGRRLASGLLRAARFRFWHWVKLRARRGASGAAARGVR